MSILLLGDGPETSRLRQRLARHFLAVETARTFAEARELALRCRFHAVLVVDSTEPWPQLLQKLEDCDGLPAATLLIADRSRAETAVDALRAGVSDVLLRPFSTEDLVASVKAIGDKATQGPQPRNARSGLALVGNTGAMREIRVLIERIAPADTTVLVEGEPGTGRALVARLLHARSRRRGPLITVDCAGIGRGRPGRELARRVRDAAGGTLFLRDIHSMPLDVQAEMLRSIGQPAIDGDGSRIVASTRVDLAELVARKRFREDLRHRLGVLRIGLPPLRERRADIPLLAAHFVDRLSAEKGLSRVELQPAEIEALGKYDWPGNLRELRSTVEQTLLRGRLPADALTGTAEPGAGTPDYPLDWTLEQIKRHHMARVLDACNGNKSAAARRLDISRKTLDRKLGVAGRE